MFVILEGVDGAGKSTLADALTEELEEGRFEEVELLHRGPPTADVISEYVLPIQHYRPGQNKHLVCDRWHLGEEVYGPELRDRSLFDPVTFSHVERVLLTRGALVVHLDPPLETLSRRIEERGDDLIGISSLRRLQRGYRKVRTRSQLPWIRFDQDWDPKMLVGMILAAAEHLDRAFSVFNEHSTYTGELTTKHLLLGDVRNGDDPPHQAAFTPGPATSGRYLLEHLDPYLRTNAGVANACEEDVGQLWETLGRPSTVALGKNSQRACARAGIPHGAVPHPQFVRRFHHRAGLEYAALIREVLVSGEDRIGWRP